MTRIERERLEDLGRAFSEALSEIADSTTESGAIAVREEEPYGDPTVEPVDIREARAMVQREENPLAPYEVNIKQVNNGFIVNVGCQTFAFESFEKLSKYMGMYFENPTEVTSKHWKGELFK